MVRKTFTLLLVGPDGSGKSTLASSIARRLELQGFSVRRGHFDPLTAPVEGLVQDPQSLPVRNALPAAASIIWRFRHYAKFAALLFNPSGPDFFVHERGWTDQLVDPRRYRLPERSGWLVSVLGRCLPRPDLEIRCVGDPAEMAARKQELSAEETALQLRRLSKGYARSRVTLQIDTTRTLEEACVELAITELRNVWVGRCMSSDRTLFGLPSRLSAFVVGNGRRGVRTLYTPTTAVGRVRLAGCVPLRLGPRPTRPIATAVRVAMWETGSQAAAVIRSSGRDRHVGALLRDGAPAGIAKFGKTNDPSLDAELQCLRTLNGSVGSNVAAPRFRNHLVVGDTSILITDYVEGVSADVEVDLRQAVEVAVAVAELGIRHGDLTPWNLRRQGSGWMLFDWECCSSDVAPAEDLARYVAASITMRNGLSRSRALAALTEIAEDPGVGPGCSKAARDALRLLEAGVGNAKNATSHADY